MIVYKNSVGLFIQKKRTKQSDFTIISNDCWGAEVYRYLGLQYTTPFIGLFMMAPCYIKLLQNFESNVRSEVTFTKTSKYSQQNELRKQQQKYYPIGLLNNDIEIHFLHYKSEEEAREQWNKRLERINFGKLYFKFDCGKDFCTYQLIKAFDSLSFEHKLCLSPQPYSEFKSVVYVKHWEADGAIMFQKTMKYFDVIGWINNKTINNTFVYRLFSSFL